MIISTRNRRRKIRYSSLDDLRLDIDFFAQHECITVGNWSYEQILTHLHRMMDASFDGFPFQMPWPVRTAARLFRRPVLRYGLPSGFKVPKRAAALMPTDPDDLSTAVEKIHDAILRLEDHVPNKPHAVFGVLTYDEWIRLHLRHAELHMSFVMSKPGVEESEEASGAA